MIFKWIYGNNKLDSCCFVRKKVFVEEQGFNPVSEFDSIDGIAYHLLGEENGKPIAAARLFKENENGGYHCGRICILKEYRKNGAGLLIMEEIERKARTLKAKKLLLSAQKTAIGFYEKAGFSCFGEEYLDEHCPHIMMEKTLLQLD